MAKIPYLLRILLKMIGTRENPRLPQNPEKGIWYRVDMPGFMASDGSGYGFDLRLGTEDKLIIFFHGGGVSWDRYMAARPISIEADTDDMYYTPSAEHCHGEVGLFSKKNFNAFRDWNIIALPYCTGDFHCGRVDFPYTAVDGTDKILYQHGYKNTIAALEKAVSLLAVPEKLLICGNSAGGFGASFLADTIIGMFPGCSDITVYNDSAMLLRDDWTRILRDVWKAPESIWKNVKTQNAVLDCFLALKEKYPDVKLMFSSSTRDYNLSVIEGYDKMGSLIPEREYGDHYFRALEGMCEGMKGVGLFIFNTPASGKAGRLGFTKHCIVIDFDAARVKTNGKTLLEWLADGVEGNIRQFGLNYLKGVN